jgi:tetratricopeptide (TPR) repeat protein
MAFDKVKTLRAAERYLELGKIPAAIKEYYKIVESEPEDFTTLNMLGDLYVRVGNQSAAISCFRRIAEHYRDQDFGLKAIAMYRKIDRLQPHDIETANSLADLYAHQGLVVEARAHYLFLADVHNKAGATKEGLAVLRKIADLDPQNTTIRTKLAEAYLHEGMTHEAGAAFADAGQHLLSRGACDEALEAYGKAIKIRPADLSTLKGLLAAHAARGTADEAAEMIERVAADNPEDTDLSALLANAYVEAEDPARAEQATTALVVREPSAYLRYLEVARLYLSCDQIDDAVRMVSQIAEQMLAEREDNKLLDVVNELLACDSDHVQALRLLVRAHWWQRDTEKLKAALERLAEAAQAAGLEQDERYALTQLTRLAPDQPHHLERLNQLGGAEEPAEDEGLAGFATVAEDDAPAPVERELHTEATIPLIKSTEFEFEWNSIIDEEEPVSQPVPEVAEEPAFTFETVVAEELPSTFAEERELLPNSEAVGPTSSADESRNASIRAQELESVDFYIAQGYVDIALDTLDLLENQFGAHVDIDLRRRQLQGAPEGAEPASGESEFTIEGGALVQSQEVTEPTFVMAPTIVSESESLPAPPPNAKAHAGIDPGLAEIFEEYRVAAEAEGEATSNGDFETHYNLGLAYKEMDLFEEALEEFQVAAGLVAPMDGTSRYLQCCNLLGHCFMQKGVPQLAVQWFNKGLTVANASDDERQALRYELGAAYEQAGDLDRAIEIFTEVYGSNVSYRGVNERLRDLQARVNGNGSSVKAGIPPGQLEQTQRLN